MLRTSLHRLSRTCAESNFGSQWQAYAILAVRSSRSLTTYSTAEKGRRTDGFSFDGSNSSIRDSADLQSAAAGEAHAFSRHSFSKPFPEPSDSKVPGKPLRGHSATSLGTTRRRSIPPLPRVTGDLFNALMYQQVRGSDQSWKTWNTTDPVTALASDDERTKSAAYMECLSSLCTEGDIDGAIKYVSESADINPALHVWSWALMTRACLKKNDLERTDECFTRLEQVNSSHAAFLSLLTNLRISVANRYAASLDFEGVLRTLRWSHASARDDVTGHIESLPLGNASLLWSVLMLALNSTGCPEHALAVLNAVSRRGIALDNSLCHLGIEAHGALNRPDDAVHLFEKFLCSNGVPNERTVGSLLRIIVRKRSNRGQCYALRGKVHELIELIPDPSERFLNCALRAFVHVGDVSRAETTFEQLCKIRGGRLPDERTCLTMMGCYATLLMEEAPESLGEADIDRWYMNLDARADSLWSRYVAQYGHVPPTMEESHARLSIFPRYILIKSIGQQLELALDLISRALAPASAAKQPWFEPSAHHFAFLLIGVDRTCDVVALEKALNLMSAYEIPMSDNCLASAVSTLVGHGDPVRAAKLACSYTDSILEDQDLNYSSRQRLRLMNCLNLVIIALSEPASSGNAASSHYLLTEVTKGVERLKRDYNLRVRNKMKSHSVIQEDDVPT